AGEEERQELQRGDLRSAGLREESQGPQDRRTRLSQAGAARRPVGDQGWLLLRRLLLTPRRSAVVRRAGPPRPARRRPQRPHPAQLGRGARSSGASGPARDGVSQGADLAARLTMLRPGSRNLITDVDGILVGNEEDQRLRSGVSVVLCERPSVASVDVRGGAPGTRETDLLDPSCRVDAIDAICLSGGSAFGLS